MPIYEYACNDCGYEFERMQSFNDEPLCECPRCTGRVRRLISSVGVIFKGSGWYITDSKRQIAAAKTAGARKSLTDGTSGATEAGGTEGAAKSESSSTGDGEKSTSDTQKTPAKKTGTKATA